MVTEPKGASTVAAGNPGTDQDLVVDVRHTGQGMHPVHAIIGMPVIVLIDSTNENTSCGQLAFIAVVGPQLSILIDNSDDETK